MNIRVRSISLLLVLFALLCGMSHYAFAQPLPERVTFRGTVIDDAATPLANAQVMLRRRANTGVAFWGAAIKTDEKGGFEFPNIEAGTYSISISANGDLNNRGATIQRARVLVPQGRAAVKEESAPIINQLLAIEPNNAPAKFQLLRFGSLRAVLKDAAGAAVGGDWFTVLLKPAGENATPGSAEVFRMQLDAEKTMNLNRIAPGRYNALGWIENVGYIEQSSFEIVPGTSPKPFTWTLKPGGTLKILAANAAGKAVGGARISLTRLSDDEAAPRNRGEATFFQNLQYDTTRDGDGALEIAGLPPGRYAVAASFTDASRAVQRAAKANRREIVDIEEGKTGELRFVLDMKNGTALKVQIVDGKGAPRGDEKFRITVQNTRVQPNLKNKKAQNDTAASEREIRTDANGFATLFPIAPGTYKMMARLVKAEVFGKPIPLFNVVTATVEVGGNAAPLVLVAR